MNHARADGAWLYRYKPLHYNRNSVTLAALKRYTYCPTLSCKEAVIQGVRLSIIVPFHANLNYLARVLAPLQGLESHYEVIVVADGAREDCRATAAAAGAVVVDRPQSGGPAAARNEGAAVARGEILIFVDADVVVSKASLQRLDELFTERPEASAIFGAYDEEPDAPNFISQYKNLAHSYIHQTANVVSQTFWGGFGAVRARAFAAMGGFDERFGRPSVEDIDLGYRLTAAGHLVLLDHQLRVQHLKRWTFTSLLVSDIRDRGIPWTQLILASGRVHNDLNLRNAYRICVVLTYLMVLVAAASLVDGRAAIALVPLAAAVYGLNRGFYRFFRERRGLWFALRVVPMHLLYHLYNGLSFVVGTTLYLVQGYLGLRLPGALPRSPWRGNVRARAAVVSAAESARLASDARSPRRNATLAQ